MPISNWSHSLNYYCDVKAQTALSLAQHYIYSKLGYAYNSQQFKDVFEDVVRDFMSCVLDPNEVEYQIEYWKIKNYDPSKYTENGQLIEHE